MDVSMMTRTQDTKALLSFQHMARQGGDFLVMTLAFDEHKQF
jgi:hypothetical protein